MEKKKVEKREVLNSQELISAFARAGKNFNINNRKSLVHNISRFNKIKLS